MICICFGLHFASDLMSGGACTTDPMCAGARTPSLQTTNKEAHRGRALQWPTQFRQAALNRRQQRSRRGRKHIRTSSNLAPSFQVIGHQKTTGDGNKRWSTQHSTFEFHF